MTNTIEITRKREKTRLLFCICYILSISLIQLVLFTKAHITFKMSAIFKKVKPLVSLCIRWWYKVIIFIFQVLEKKQTFVDLILRIRDIRIHLQHWPSWVCQTFLLNLTCPSLKTKYSTPSRNIRKINYCLRSHSDISIRNQFLNQAWAQMFWNPVINGIKTTNTFQFYITIAGCKEVWPFS